ncbi:MAG TPA: hypothetical protein V6D20_13555, partial [Candidatus Obscuribacterales bacterium]
ATHHIHWANQLVKQLQQHSSYLGEEFRDFRFIPNTAKIFKHHQLGIHPHDPDWHLSLVGLCMKRDNQAIIHLAKLQENDLHSNMIHDDASIAKRKGRPPLPPDTYHGLEQLLKRLHSFCTYLWLPPLMHKVHQLIQYLQANYRTAWDHSNQWAQVHNGPILYWLMTHFNHYFDQCLTPEDFHQGSNQDPPFPTVSPSAKSLEAVVLHDPAPFEIQDMPAELRPRTLRSSLGSATPSATRGGHPTPHRGGPPAGGRGGPAPNPRPGEVNHNWHPQLQQYFQSLDTNSQRRNLRKVCEAAGTTPATEMEKLGLTANHCAVFTLLGNCSRRYCQLLHHGPEQFQPTQVQQLLNTLRRGHQAYNQGHPQPPQPRQQPNRRFPQGNRNPGPGAGPPNTAAAAAGPQAPAPPAPPGNPRGQQD